MSTDLVHIGEQPEQPENSEALISFGGFGGSELASARLTIENIELIQATSRAEGGIPGQFRSKSSGQHVKEIFALPFFVQPKRVLFPAKGSGFGSQPLCRSNDGVRPAPGVIDRKSDLCQTCNFGPKLWKGYQKAKRAGASRAELNKLKPPCDGKLEFIYFDKVSYGVYRITVGGTSVSELNKSISDIENDIQKIMTAAKIEQAKAKALGTEYKPTTIGKYNFMIHLKPLKLVNDSGAFYVIKFSASRTPFEPGEEEAIGEIYNEKALAINQMRMRGLTNDEVETDNDVIDVAVVDPAAQRSQATMGEPVISDY